MSAQRIIASFYRVAKAYPPGDDEYRTARDKGLHPPDELTATELRAFNDGYSFYDSEDGARGQAKKRKGKLGTYIVRYDIPEGSGIEWEKTLGPGHYTLFGSKEELKRYLAAFVAIV